MISKAMQIIDNPAKELLAEIDLKIEGFNQEHWASQQKKPLALVLYNDENELQAGASARTFGHWLLIDNIWVDKKLRGQRLGAKLLSQLETVAIERGCVFSLLDTLDFQARPFYEKFGYEVKWTQESYPKDGCKYFMVKNLK